MKKKLLAGIAVLLLAFLYYYIELPAINIHESGFWFFLVAVIGIIVVVYAIRKRLYGTIQLKQSKGIKAGVILMLVIIAVYAVGSLLSSPIINAKKYQNLVPHLLRHNHTFCSHHIALHQQIFHICI